MNEHIRRNERRIGQMPSIEKQASEWHGLFLAARNNPAFRPHLAEYSARRDEAISRLGLDELVLLANRFKKRDPEFAKLLRGPEFTRRLEKLQTPIQRKKGWAKRAAIIATAALVGSGITATGLHHRFEQGKKAKFEQGVKVGLQEGTQRGRMAGFYEGLEVGNRGYTRVIVDGKSFVFSKDAYDEIDRISRATHSSAEEVIRTSAQFAALPFEQQRNLRRAIKASADSAIGTAHAKGLSPTDLQRIREIVTADSTLTGLAASLRRGQQGWAPADSMWAAILRGVGKKVD